MHQLVALLSIILALCAVQNYSRTMNGSNLGSALMPAEETRYGGPPWAGIPALNYLGLIVADSVALIIERCWVPR